jgi:hypothetical protein
LTQFLLEHLQQHQLTRRARECVTGLGRLRIDLDVAQEPGEEIVTHALIFHAVAERSTTAVIRESLNRYIGKGDACATFKVSMHRNPTDQGLGADG